MSSSTIVLPGGTPGGILTPAGEPAAKAAGVDLSRLGDRATIRDVVAICAKMSSSVGGALYERIGHEQTQVLNELEREIKGDLVRVIRGAVIQELEARDPFYRAWRGVKQGLAAIAGLFSRQGTRVIPEQLEELEHNEDALTPDVCQCDDCVGPTDEQPAAPAIVR